MEPNQLLYIIQLTEALNRHSEMLERFGEQEQRTGERMRKMAESSDRLSMELKRTREMWNPLEAVN